MTPPPTSPSASPSGQATWITRATLLWEHRRLLGRVTGIALVLSLLLAFVLPKQYESVAKLMPPDQQGGSAALLAAVAGRSLAGLGGLGSLAGGLLGGHTSTALYIDLLQSRIISDRIIDRFDLQKINRERHRIDAVKFLARHTTIVDDKKSGVITLTYSDPDPVRARAIVLTYIDELNQLMTKANTSSARREREFIEHRLITVNQQLHDAETALSNFSSVNTTLDIKAQTQTMVEAAAKLQAELIVAQSDLDSLMQIYGNDNVRVRSTRARIDSLQHELNKLSGSSAPLPSGTDKTGTGKTDTATPNTATPDTDSNSLYPSLRQLPRLAVPYAALYRNVRVQETVFELLSQEYEVAHIEEAKDTPAVSVFDPPLVAEVKSFPPRRLIIFGGTVLAFAFGCFYIVLREQWRSLSDTDPRRQLAQQIAASLRRSPQPAASPEGPQ
jgi:uncharacterized protein involved in exopolysaccharide biosynthesis